MSKTKFIEDYADSPLERTAELTSILKKQNEELRALNKILNDRIDSLEENNRELKILVEEYENAIEEYIKSCETL